MELQRQQAESLRQQRDMLDEQRQQQRILLPFLAEQEGFDIEMDDQGRLKSIKKRTDPDEAKRKDLERMYLDRATAAMKGDLPVDPALERSLKLQETQLRERLQSQFGEGYETASPAIEALSKFQKTSEDLRYGARTGQLTLAEQLGLTREQQDQYTKMSNLDQLRTGAIGDPLTIAGAYGQNAQGFGSAMQPYMQNRNMALQASMANRSNLFQLLGAGIGAAGRIGSAAMMFSDPTGKENLVEVSKTLDGIPIYEYNLVGEAERRLGVISTDVEMLYPTAVYSRFGYDAVDYDEFELEDEFFG